MITKINDIISQNNIIGIAGHVHPDGDAIGSTLALYNYIKTNYPDKKVDLYLEDYNCCFDILVGIKERLNSCLDKKYELFFALDSASLDRIGVARELFSNANTTVVIDHHKTNNGFGDINIINPDASSVSEMIYELLDETLLNKDIASCIYTGIIHDTGLFQYTNTSPRTLLIASKLIEYAIPFTSIIEQTFFEKTLVQTKAMSYVLGNAIVDNDKHLIIGTLELSEMKELAADKNDLDSIVANLRNVSEIDVAVFVYEIVNDDNDDLKLFKVSLRSKNDVDVSVVASKYNGGGHTKAAGCIIKACDIDKVVNEIISNF